MNRAIFYNAFIQYFFVEALKLNLVSMTMVKADEKYIGDEIAAYTLLLLIIFFPLLFFSLLYKKRTSLSD